MTLNRIRLAAYISVSLIFLTTLSCRKQQSPDEIDLADYGWVLFEDESYLESNAWFRKSIDQDPVYKDGYNGMGWSFGKLLKLDSSLMYFNMGLNLPEDPYSTINIKQEILAGLCFAYNANGQDSLAVIWGETLLTEIDKLVEPVWVFSHNETIDLLDINLTLAISAFAMGKFSKSLSHVHIIMEKQNPGSSLTFTPNLITTGGRNKLAGKIEELQGLLSSP